MQPALATSPNSGLPLAVKKRAEDQLIRAAGLLILTPNAEALFLRYTSGHKDSGGKWTIPCGELEDDEEAEEAAVRETFEETGWNPSGEIRALHSSDQDEVNFTTFGTVTQNQFIPELSDEHDGWQWAPLDSPPEPLHYGSKQTIDNLTIGEDAFRDVADNPIVKQAVTAAAQAALYHVGQVWDPSIDKEIEHIADTLSVRFDVSKSKILAMLAPAISQLKRRARDEIGARGNAADVNSAHPRAANVASRTELNSIGLPKTQPASRAINIAYANGGTTGPLAKQSSETNRYINSGGLTKDEAVRGKIERGAFLYLENPDESDFAQCKTCWLFDRGAKRCGILPDDFEVSAEDSCGYYLEGNFQLVDAPKVKPADVGFVKATKVRCENCYYSDGEGNCKLYELLNLSFPDFFDLDTKINSRGCCNAFQSAE